MLLKSMLDILMSIGEVTLMTKNQLLCICSKSMVLLLAGGARSRLALFCRQHRLSMLL